MKKLPDQWAKFYGMNIVDADGWPNRDLSQPVDLEEFLNRIVSSTIVPIHNKRYGEFERILTFSSKQ